ncbi:MAG: hypothetical protein HC888_12465 [Candidatus Competibacteraceae bacterium]|nr:hypothetical protein [Candidatus Competibacteraceae bacterium]
MIPSVGAQVPGNPDRLPKPHRRRDQSPRPVSGARSVPNERVRRASEVEARQLGMELPGELRGPLRGGPLGILGERVEKLGPRPDRVPRGCREAGDARVSEDPVEAFGPIAPAVIQGRFRETETCERQVLG